MTIPDPEPTIEAMRAVVASLRSVTAGPGSTAKAVRKAIDSLTAQLSFVLADMDQTKAHEAEGASSIATWARRELGQDAGLTRQLVRNARTMTELPEVGEAALAGTIGERHVTAFTFSLKHIGEDQTHSLEVPLLTLATLTTPRELFAKIREVRAVAHPDALDEAWLAGMDKQDISLTRLPDGWFLTGHLGIETGTKLDIALRSWSVPRDAGDDRTPAERRMDGLDELLDSVLRNGLPADRGFRPNLRVTVTADQLKDIYAPTDQRPLLDLDATPIHLEGFGPVGRNFTGYLLCNAEVTPLLIDTVNGKVEVLDVGDSKRHATERQGIGISHRQHGQCANPGCHHPIGHIHHVIWWSHGGTTTLDTMLGLCRKLGVPPHEARSGGGA
ncbi:hypothetical protein ASD11_12760 [Aeromicrobium sp. Root495]|uniref:HNH endonuclease n=1 Tax=Aeromicrobium sp. Root495 TaxID=1736550 RepID=UPI0006FB9094|nr:DUF222 domain-containing protein [Aeromicrobium sp. Root495]KQY60320.1 hypothetical protein ASD11_12760 [Aeromicrobium sp. Root495]